MTTTRYHVIEMGTRKPEGDRPYLDPGRALMRAMWLNLVAQELRYTLLPVRWKDAS